VKNDVFTKTKVFFARLARRLTGRPAAYFRIGRCLRCGACCRDVVLTYHGNKISGEEEFARLVEEEPVYGIFRLKMISEKGIYIFQCSRLGEDNRCTAYHDRPGVCSDYPDPDLLRCGTDVIEECGYYLVGPEDFRL